MHDIDLLVCEGFCEEEEGQNNCYCFPACCHWKRNTPSACLTQLFIIFISWQHINKHVWTFNTPSINAHNYILPLPSISLSLSLFLSCSPSNSWATLKLFNDLLALSAFLLLSLTTTSRECMHILNGQSFLLPLLKCTVKIPVEICARRTPDSKTGGWLAGWFCFM